MAAMSASASAPFASGDKLSDARFAHEDARPSDPALVDEKRSAASGSSVDAEVAADEKRSAASGLEGDIEAPVTDEKADASDPKVVDVPPDGGYGCASARMCLLQVRVVSFMSRLLSSACSCELTPTQGSWPLV